MKIPLRILAVSAAWRVVCLALLFVSAQLQQPFDTSGDIVQYTLAKSGNPAAWVSWAAPFVRWDTVYFVAAADYGYTHEQMLAFQPGIVGLIRLADYLHPGNGWNPTVAVLVATALANLAAWLGPLLLFYLVRMWSGNDGVAFRAALLSVLAPASTTAMSAPTPEPFFSVFSLLGYLALTSSSAILNGWKRPTAAICFAIATLFRANGLLLAGYLVWHAAWQSKPASFSQFLLRLVGVIPWLLVSVSPWILFQIWAYARLCTGGTISPWCTSRLPLAYSYIQSTYWDVGLFRYWTVSQLPNFILASPVLLAMAHALQTFTSRHSYRNLIMTVAMPWKRMPLHAESSKVLPYVLHVMIMLMILLMASHVQIALRLCTPGGLPYGY
ncbi:ER membrane glycoprotein subunit of the GPI transamidase complex-like protein [Malassezia psittaci]|uniref:GPI mannosyltransferase 2 n=1 Tax=Malassezia psittaci TaxID=1821823 RepID=A0AAF0FCW4_9BASI|nr:ER membrane glycoprotein subunit of the GPI transamidase complex-like protein [Malassezia psittaci]